MAEVTVTVERGENGALGIEVDNKNTVATSKHDSLRVGDKIVAVDGVRLDRPISQVLKRQDAYEFVVEREEGAAALESLQPALSE